MSYMVKKDDVNEKKTANPRGRIMQVVEIEEENTSKQKVDVPVPVDIVKNADPPSISASSSIKSEENKLEDKPEDEDEKPDIASSFPMSEQDEEKNQASPKTVESTGEDIPALRNGDKKDIVSELFETKNTSVQYPDISLDKKPKRFGFFLWVIILLGIVGAIGGGLLYFKQTSSSSEQVQTAIPSPTVILVPTETETETPSATPSGKTKTPTPTNSATPSATPKKTGLSIQVLNGSGTSGVASAMKKFLEEKGYNVIGTGNAKNFDYANTEIIIKADKSSSLDKLKTDLSASYTVGSTSATLDVNASYDAQVIIGKE